MLRCDPIVQKYPDYLPTEEELRLTRKLLRQPEHSTLHKAVTDHIAIGGCLDSTLLRYCWTVREDGLHGQQCAEGTLDLLYRCMASREKLKLDTILYDGPFSEDFTRLYTSTLPFSFHRTDKLGHPVLIQRFGQVDVDAFEHLWAEGEALQSRAGLAVNAVVLFHLRSMEYCTKVLMGSESLRQGRIVDRILVVMDMDGISLAHARSSLADFMKAVSAEGLPLFPETLHATLCANLPWIVANVAWPVAKCFLRRVTQAKVCMLSSPEELHLKLAELMAPEDVPSCFGGHCTCDMRGGSFWTWEQNWRSRGDAGQLEVDSLVQEPTSRTPPSKEPTDDSLLGKEEKGEEEAESWCIPF